MIFWHISEGAHMVASNCGSLSSITGDFSVFQSSQTSLTSATSAVYTHKGVTNWMKLMWLDRCLLECGQEWNKIRLNQIFQLCFNCSDTRCWTDSCISHFSVKSMKEKTQILPVPTFFNSYPQVLRLSVRLIWFLSSIRIVFCCKC